MYLRVRNHTQTSLFQQFIFQIQNVYHYYKRWYSTTNEYGLDGLSMILLR